MTLSQNLAIGLLSFGLMVSLQAKAIPFDQIKDAYPTNPPDVTHVPDAKPVALPYSKYGNPSVYDVNGVQYHVLSSSKGYSQSGFASWYGTKFQGRRTSSGERYDMYEMTAASTTLPIPSFVKVTNLENGKSVVVKVNDRGPFHSNRIMDLSYAAAAKLDILRHGTAPVHVEAIDASGHSSAVFARSIYDLRGNESISTSDTQSTVQHDQVFRNDEVLRNNPSFTHDNNNNRTFVQVASFSRSAKAHQLADNLRDEVGKPVSINQVTYNGAPHYRVLIGPLDSEHEAISVASSLQHDGLGQSVIVQA